MPVDVIMPQMGESIQEGTLVKWLKKPGDTVARDEPLFEISTDKVDAEIPSPAAGVLGEIKVKEGETVAIKTVVATIETEGAPAGARESAPAQAAAGRPSAPQPSAAQPSAPQPAPRQASPAGQPATQQPSGQASVQIPAGGAARAERPAPQSVPTGAPRG